MPTALITGGSAGLGQALATELVARSWTVIITARHEQTLRAAAAELAAIAIPGDVADPDHIATLVAAVRDAGGLDLLVHNASTLGASPLPAVADLSPATLEHIWRTNVAGPVALTRALLPDLRRSGGTVIGVSSDAAVGHYPTWGGYGSSKAALDHLVLTLGEEEDTLHTYAVDPGDMRTAMHQAAFPGQDISDRPEASTSVPGLMHLITTTPANGRYQARTLRSQSVGG